MKRIYPTVTVRILLGICFLLPAALKAQLRFIPNAGQWPEPFQYKADIPGGAAFLQENTIWYNFSNGAELAHQQHNHQYGQVTDTIERGHAIKLEYLGASTKLALSPEKQSSTLYNYFIGKEQYWRSGLLASSDIRYKNLYDGIDMLIEGSSDALKYTFFLKRGTDPGTIHVRITGASSTQVSEGALHIKTTLGEILEQPPMAWQWHGDKKIDIPCRYVLHNDVVSFEFPQGYNPKLDLVIDPFVVFASYSGSTADNFGYTATYDDQGHAYGGGDVWSQGYPVTAGAYQTKFTGAIDVGIIKYTADGSKLLYATYLGGVNHDRPHSMIVNSDTELIILGTTWSPNFPITKGAYDTVVNGYDIFISRLSKDGTKLRASTVIGGTARDGINNFDGSNSPLTFNYADEFRGEIIVDATGDVYVASTTHSKDFPTTPWSMQPTLSRYQEGIAFRMNKDLTKLRWGTFIGGTACDAAFGIQFDKKGDVYICGGTASQHIFPDTTMYQDSIKYLSGSSSYFDSLDAFVCHLTGDSGKFINGTYLGTQGYEQAYFVQLDTSGLIYLYGQTRSDSFPVVNPHYLDKHGSQFISILNKTLDTLILSTRFGSGQKKPDISPTAFLVDNCGSVYISGWGGEVNQPQYGGHGGYMGHLKITSDAFQKTTDSSDFYIAVFAPKMDTLLYATFFGNPHVGEHVDGGTSRFDKHAVVYQSVCGSCEWDNFGLPDPITTPNAWSRVNKGKRASNPREVGCNNLVLKLDVRIPDIKAGFIAPSLACKGDGSPTVVRFQNTSTRATNYAWDFGDGNTSNSADAVHLYNDTGTYLVRLAAINPNSCSLTDTFSKSIKIIRHSNASFSIDSVACDGTVILKATGVAAEYAWDFGDGYTAKGDAIVHKYTADGTYKIKLVADRGTLCVDSSEKPVTISFPHSNFTYTVDTCDLKVFFQNQAVNAVFYTWDFGDNTYDTFPDPSHVYKANTLYYVTLTITDPRGCIVEHTDSIKIKNELASGFGFSQDTCSGKTTFNNTSKHGEKYLWDFGDGTTDTVKSPVHFFTKDSLYTVRLVVTSKGGCTDTTNHFVQGYPSPHGTFEFEKDSCTSEVKFKSNVFRGYHADWDFGDGSEINHEWNPKHTYDKKGNYTVRFIMNSGSGCVDTVVQQVTVTNDKPSPVEVPNVFTPNNDSKNDVLIIEGNTKCVEFEVEIYNRWGQLVFKEKGNLLTWDGHSIQGHELPAGVYYYILRDPNFGEKHGTVTLLRE